MMKSMRIRCSTISRINILLISKYLFIHVFSLLTTSFKNSSRDFHDNFQYLGYGSGANFGSNSCSIFGSKFFIGNNLLLKLLRIFFLSVKNNPLLLRNKLFY